MHPPAGVYGGLLKPAPQPSMTLGAGTFAKGEEEVTSGTRKASVI